jgi:hypothetical protein
LAGAGCVCCAAHPVGGVAFGGSCIAFAACCANPRCAFAASIARKIYLRSGTGVGAFRKVYGGNKNKGTRKEKFQKASGGMIRSILVNLQNMGVVEKLEDGCVAHFPGACGGCSWSLCCCCLCCCCWCCVCRCCVLRVACCVRCSCAARAAFDRAHSCYCYA